jgi:hypothetical protein
MILESPSKYASNKFYPLADFTILETTSLMNYSINHIDDTSGQIILLSSIPYNVGQKIRGLKIKYIRLYGDSNETIGLLVDEESSKIIDKYGSILINTIMELSF